MKFKRKPVIMEIEAHYWDGTNNMLNNIVTLFPTLS